MSLNCVENPHDDSYQGDSNTFKSDKPGGTDPEIENEIEKTRVPCPSPEIICEINENLPNNEDASNSNNLENNVNITKLSNNEESLTNQYLTKNHCTDEQTILDISIRNNEKFDIPDKARNVKTISRSCENINICDVQLRSDCSNSNEILNSEQILKDFSLQKTKVAKILAGQQKDDDLTDAKLIRMHKETITHDLGSIVKNVHGIFSSVSGSLKNAYKTNPQLNKAIPNEIEKADVSSSASVVPTPEPPVQEQLDPVDTERSLTECKIEVSMLCERVKQQSDMIINKDRVIKEMEAKIELLKRHTEYAEREMNAAVMRYATSERSALEARAEAERAKKNEKNLMAEVALVNTKLKSAFTEKQRICQLYDDKCHEHMTTERELSRLKEEFTQLDTKHKWTQGRLKSELDNYKESTLQIEKLTQKLSELESQRDQYTTNTQELQRAKQLEMELKESRAALILSRHDVQSLESTVNRLTGDLEVSHRQLTERTDRLKQLEEEVTRLSASNIQLEQEAAELAALRARAALVDTLTDNLQRENERAAQLETDVARERSRAAASSDREAKALAHAAQLVARDVDQQRMQSELESKALALTIDNKCLRDSVTTLEGQLKSCSVELEMERAKRIEESHLLAKKVAELTGDLEELSKQLEWEKGENGVLKRKYNSSVKELNRELQRSLKRCEHLESKLVQHESQDVTSTRTGSISSLSSCGNEPTVKVNGHTEVSSDEMQSSPPKTNNHQVREPDRQTLIERIVELQRTGARRSERIDFLEEHTRQLTGELRKKSKLLRHLATTLPAGALAQQLADDNKKEMARLGGGSSAMAALWGGDTDGVTLELSLEINQKLQAVLEDTLLKNITLKENMETLGAEIERLKREQGKVS